MNMKKTYIMQMSLASLFLLNGVACMPDAEDYDPAELVDGVGAYFLSSAPSQVDLDGTATTFSVAINRSNTDEAGTVNLNVTEESGLFSVPTSVTFNAGEATADIVISYDPVQLGYGNYYPIMLAVADETSQTPYAPAEYSFTAGIPQTWSAIAIGNYTYASLAFSGMDEGLTLYKNDQDPTRYKIEKWCTGVDFCFTYDEATGQVVVDDQTTGYVDSTNGEIFIVETAVYVGDPSFGYGYYEDGVFNFSVIYYVSAGYFGYGIETFDITEELLPTEVSTKSVSATKRMVLKDSLQLYPALR